MKHKDYPEWIKDLFEEVTGLEWDESEDDSSGCYFSRGHWVGADSICNMLKIVHDRRDW